MSDWTFCPHCGSKLDPADTACPSCGAAVTSAETATSRAELAALTQELREALAPELQLLQPLGQGGMSTVFLARDPALKRMVAVKVLSPALAREPVARKRFEREAESAAAVSHPNVVGIHRVGELPRSGTSYFVMHFVEGETLGEAFPPGTVVPEPRVRRIVGEVASALAAAHARGLVHRDIKPGNIMLEAETDRAIVLDFGISAAVSPDRRARETRLTVEGSSIGTPQYMSPEQAAGEEVTDRSDVYSLGLVVFELLTGRPPFQEANVMALAAAHINKEAPGVRSLRPDVDPGLAELVRRCLAKNPDERPSAEQVTRSLGVVPKQVIEWPPPGLESVRALGARFSNAVAVAVGIGLVLFVLLRTSPTFDSPGWQYGETSELWFSVGGGARSFREPSTPARDPTSIWLFLMELSAVAMVGVGAFAAVRGVNLGVGLLRARRSGYPMATCLDVAFDRHGDTAALRNGTGMYAGAAPETLALLLRRRRWQAAAILVMPLMSVPTAWAWLAAWSSSAASGPVVISRPALLLVTLPFVVGLLAVLGLGVWERRVLGHRPPTLVEEVRRLWQPLVRGELASAWLENVGARSSPATGMGSLVFGGLVQAVALGALAVLLAFMLLTTWVVASTTETTAFARPATLAWEQTMRSDSAVRWVAVDTALARSPLTSRPSAGPTDMDAAYMLLALLREDHPDRAERRESLSAVSSPVESPAWAAPDTDLGFARLPPEAYGISYIELGGRKVFFSPRWFFSSFGGLGSTLGNIVLPDSVDARFEAAVSFPGYRAFRRFARHDPPPPLWMYRPDFGGITKPTDLPRLGNVLGLSTQWDAWMVSDFAAASAFLALDRGDTRAARDALLDLVTAGRSMAETPIPPVHGWGVQMVHDGLRQLAGLGWILKDQTLHAEALRLDSLVLTYILPSPNARLDRGRGFTWGPELGVLPMLEADPTRPTAIPSGDPTLDWGRIRAVVPAFCLNPREVLLGVDRRRGALIRKVAPYDTVPRLDEWVKLNLRWLQEWRASTGAAITDPAGRRPRAPLLVRPLAWLGLAGLRDRIAYCNANVWVRHEQLQVPQGIRTSSR